MNVRSKLTGVDRQLGDEVDVPSILQATLATQPNQTKPNQTKPNQTKPSQAKPSQNKPDQGLERSGFDLPNGVVESASFGDASRSNFGHRSGFYLIGLLLMATAIAKLWMLVTDSFADVRVGIPREILWLSVAFELWLAYENFRLRDFRVMSFINTIVFAIFGLFASLRWMMGYESCGCSGKFEIPGWIFILIDVGIVAWFVGTFSRRTLLGSGLQQLVMGWKSLSTDKRGRWAGILLFAGLLIGLQLPVAAPIRAVVLGKPALNAAVKIEGELKVGREIAGTVEISNFSSNPAKIIGVAKSCRCFKIASDPILKIVPAGKSIFLPLVIKPNKSGPLHQRIELFLDHPKLFRVNVDVLGSVKE